VTFGSYYVVGSCFLLWLRDHYLDVTNVLGESMAPTLNARVHETGERDCIIIRPYLHHRDGASGIQRGDIVTFWKPRKPEEIGIKRVIATEGDIVYPKSGYAVDSDNANRLGGMPDGLPDRDEDSIASERAETGRVVVPYGHVWVEGDNLEKSLDSRDNGPIAKGLIMGKAMWLWKSWGEFVRIGDARSEREKRLASRVVEGKAAVPERFLE
jgi:inner membrane protease subunit 2